MARPQPVQGQSLPFSARVNNVATPSYTHNAAARADTRPNALPSQQVVPNPPIQRLSQSQPRNLVPHNPLGTQPELRTRTKTKKRKKTLLELADVFLAEQEVYLGSDKDEIAIASDLCYGSDEQDQIITLTNSLETDAEYVQTVGQIVKKIDKANHLGKDTKSVRDAAKETNREVEKLLEELKAVRIVPAKRDLGEEEQEQAARPSKRPKSCHSHPPSSLGATASKNTHQQATPRPSSSFVHQSSLRVAPREEGEVPTPFTAEGIESQSDNWHPILGDDVDMDASVERPAENTIGHKPVPISITKSAPAHNEADVLVTSDARNTPEIIPRGQRADVEPEDHASNQLDKDVLAPLADPTTPSEESSKRSTRPKANPEKPSKLRGNNASGRSRKSTNDIVEFPFYIWTPDAAKGTYKPIDSLPPAVREHILGELRNTCEKPKSRKTRYGRITRNPTTYTESRSSDCVCSQTIGHGSTGATWDSSNGDSNFACDACTKNIRPCVRLRMLSEMGSTEIDGDAHVMCLTPLPRSKRLNEGWDSIGFWLKTQSEGEN